MPLRPTLSLSLLNDRYRVSVLENGQIQASERGRPIPHMVANGLTLAMANEIAAAHRAIVALEAENTQLRAALHFTESLP